MSDQEKRQIEPVYHTPDGTILVPITQLEERLRSEIKDWMARTVRWMGNHLHLKVGDPCPTCHRRVDKEVRGRLADMPMIESKLPTQYD